MLPDFHRLRVFYHIYLQTSVVGAAAQLHITPSAVSQHLQKLESEIATPLFTRVHKRLIPTAAAEKLFGIVQPFVDRLQAEVQTIAHAKTAPVGHLRIGVPVEFGNMYLPRIMADYRRQYPAVTFTLVPESAAALMRQVNAGDLDFAYVDLFPIREQSTGLPAHYSVEPLFEEEVILAASGIYYREFLGRPHSFARLVDREYISYRTDAMELRNWFRHHFRRSATALNVVMEVDSHRAVMAGIRAHMGLGVIASHMAREDIRSGEIVPITTRRKSVINRIALIQLADKIPSLAEKSFQKHFTGQVRGLGLSSPYFRFIGNYSS